MLPDFRTTAIYVLLAGCVGLGLTAAIERTMVAKTKETLAVERLARKTEENERNRAALRHAEAQIAKLAAHTATQTEIANALDQAITERKRADARHDALAASVQRTAARLAAALDSAERLAERPAGVDRPDRPDTLNSLLAEGGRLIGEAASVVGEGRSVVAQRDGEVAALTAVIANDRTLATVEIAPPGAPAKLPNWTANPAP